MNSEKGFLVRCSFKVRLAIFLSWIVLAFIMTSVLLLEHLILFFVLFVVWSVGIVPAARVTNCIAVEEKGFRYRIGHGVSDLIPYHEISRIKTNRFGNLTEYVIYSGRKQLTRVYSNFDNVDAFLGKIKVD